MAWRQDGISVRPDGKLTLDLASGRWGCRPDLHRITTVRKTVLTRYLTIRGMKKRNFAYASGRGKLASWPAQEITRQEGRPDALPDDQRAWNRHFAYASGRVDDRPDGVNWRPIDRPFDRPFDRFSIGTLGSIALQPDRSLNAVPDQIKAFGRKNEGGSCWDRRGKFLADLGLPFWGFL